MFVDKIFREYDIRGIYDRDYNKDFAAILAKAVAKFLRDTLKKPSYGDTFRFAVGRDARPSGDHLAPLFKQALMDSGIEVVDLGTVPTPLVYFSTIHLDVDGAVSITGSHNPTEYNGFKLCIGKSTLHGSQIQELKGICREIEKNPPKPVNKIAKHLHVDVISMYLLDIGSKIKLSRKLKVVLDSGNGTACVVAPQLIEQLGCEVIPLFCDLDGTFPNHHPDPTELKNLVDLQAAVKKHGADLGIAYDGDADRIGAVDEKGTPIFGDELLVLYAREILARKPGATIISEVKSSHKLYNDIKARGGRPIMWKTGHSLIKAKMKEEKAELAGEMSGHMFFQDRYYGYDDAVYASARLLEILANSDKPLSWHLSDLPKTVSTPELRVDCPDEIKFDVVKLVRDELAKSFDTIDIDGVRVETKDGWGLLRASNTQPVVVMRFEASTEARLNEIKKSVEDSFRSAIKKLGGAIENLSSSH